MKDQHDDGNSNAATRRAGGCVNTDRYKSALGGHRMALNGNLGLSEYGTRNRWPAGHHKDPHVAGILIDSGVLPERLHPFKDDIRDIALLADAIRTFQDVSGQYVAGHAIQDLYTKSVEKIEEFSSRGGLQIKKEKSGARMESLNISFSNVVNFTESSSPDLLFHWGLLSTWRNKSESLLHSFFLASVDHQAKARIDAFDECVFRVYDPYFQRISGNNTLTHNEPPRFVCARSLARGGEAAIPPYHFAYFFPEDYGHPVADDNTVVLFVDSYLARFRNVSLPLGLKFIDAKKAWMNEERLYDSQMLWFRGHDISHGVKTTQTDWTMVERRFGSGVVSVLGEIVADVYGLLLLFNADVKNEFDIDSESISYSFMAELLNYLRRDPTYFFDSSAAFFEVSYLLAHKYVALDPNGKLTWEVGAVEAGMRSLAKDLCDSVLIGDLDRVAHTLSQYAYESQVRPPGLVQLIDDLRHIKF